MNNRGLEGVVATETKLSHVDGERGELIIAGYRIDDLAPNATFEETVWLLWHGDLPDAHQLAEFRRELAARRECVIPSEETAQAAVDARMARPLTRPSVTVSPLRGARGNSRESEVNS